MEKEVTIQMTSRFQGGEKISRRLQARYSLRGQEARLAYKQQLDPEWSEQIPEILLVHLQADGSPDQVTMKRPGSRFQLHFAAGESCQALYDTPAGTMEVELLTQQMTGMFTPGHIELHLQYEMRLGGESQGVTELRVKG